MAPLLLAGCKVEVLVVIKPDTLNTYFNRPNPNKAHPTDLTQKSLQTKLNQIKPHYTNTNCSCHHTKPLQKKSQRSPNQTLDLSPVQYWRVGGTRRPRSHPGRGGRPSTPWLPPAMIQIISTYIWIRLYLNAELELKMDNFPTYIDFASHSHNLQIVDKHWVIFHKTPAVQSSLK